MERGFVCTGQALAHWTAPQSYIYFLAGPLPLYSFHHLCLHAGKLRLREVKQLAFLHGGVEKWGAGVRI